MRIPSPPPVTAGMLSVLGMLYRVNHFLNQLFKHDIASSNY